MGVDINGIYFRLVHCYVQYVVTGIFNQSPSAIQINRAQSTANAIPTVIAHALMDIYVASILDALKVSVLKNHPTVP